MATPSRSTGLIALGAMMVLMDVPQEIAALLGRVSADENCVLLSRFGLDRGAPRTVEEASAELMLPISEVRAREESALAKLRALSTS